MTDTDKTVATAESEICYTVCYNAICETVYGSIDKLLNLLTFVGGCAAAVGVYSKDPTMNTIAGVLLATLAGVSLLWSPARLAEQHKSAKREAQAMMRDVRDYTKAMKQLDQIRAGAPNGLTWLKHIAWNRMIQAQGHATGLVQLNRFQRLIAAIA